MDAVDLLLALSPPPPHHFKSILTIANEELGGKGGNVVRGKCDHDDFYCCLYALPFLLASYLSHVKKVSYDNLAVTDKN